MSGGSPRGGIASASRIPCLVVLFAGALLAAAPVRAATFIVDDTAVAAPGQSNAILKVVLDGSLAGAGAHGLDITSGGSTVRGAVAAFSPSGLSVDEPAHVYHTALLKEIVSGEHDRLGDAVLAAQRDYADSGAAPELLSVYNLFGDPAMRIRR